MPPTCCLTNPPCPLTLPCGTREQGVLRLRAGTGFLHRKGSGLPHGDPCLGPAAHPRIAGHSSKIILLTVVRVHERARCCGLSHARPPSARAWKCHHCTPPRAEALRGEVTCPRQPCDQRQDGATPVWLQSDMAERKRYTFTHPSHN